MNSMTTHTKRSATRFSVVCALMNAITVLMIGMFINTNVFAAYTNEYATTSESTGVYEDLTEYTTIETTSETTVSTEATEPDTEPTTNVVQEVETVEEITKEETQPEKEKVLKYKYGRRMTPAVDINIPTGTNMRNYTGEVDTSGYTYLGTFNITGYTPKCVHCCGNDKGITASGVEAIAGYTVAAHKSISFGTTLYIEGYGYYVVEDRGHLAKNTIDIAAPTHDSCYTLTNSGVNVYVVPH